MTWLKNLARSVSMTLVLVAIGKQSLAYREGGSNCKIDDTVDELLGSGKMLSLKILSSEKKALMKPSV